MTIESEREARASDRLYQACECLERVLGLVQEIKPVAKELGLDFYTDSAISGLAHNHHLLFDLAGLLRAGSK